MTHGLRIIRLASLAAALAFAARESDASACGGCFHPENQANTTVVTAHRMALSISPAQTVLWDQVEYAGAPSEFAWVLPVRPGARLEVATDAWIETLDAATSTRTMPPRLFCPPPDFGGTEGDVGDFGGTDGEGSGSGCSCSHLGCGSGFAADSGGFGAGGSGVGAAGAGTGGGLNMPPPPPPVDIVHQGTVGPYETVTLHANQQGALTSWLIAHSFAIDADIMPIIDAYTAGGFDFIALRLAPNAGIQQMKPVRVISPGAVPTLPLRMVAAGTGANVAITLFIIGEGRWETKNFPGVLLDTTQLSWDFSLSNSNYAMMRAALLAQNNGRSWLTAYAKPGTLLQADIVPGVGAVQYGVNNGYPETTIGGAYVFQGYIDKEADPIDPNMCIGKLQDVTGSADLVVDPCAPSGGAGSGGGGGGSAGSGGAGGAGNGGAGGAGNGGADGGVMCAPLKPGEIDVAQLKCGRLDDLGTALIGMHPRDVWLTRLESALPRAALADDLEIQAASSQTTVQNWVTATQATNNPCPLAAVATAPPPGARRSPRSGPSRGNRDLTMFGAGLAALLVTISRRGARALARRGRLVPARTGS